MQTQEAPREPVRIGQVLTPSGNVIMPQDLKKPTESPKVITNVKPESKLKAAVLTFTTPEQILNQFLSYTDKDDMIKFLSSWQKSQAEWDVFRKKIPDELLEKWGTALRKCRENGFINPHIDGNKITWQRILVRNTKHCDKCFLCDRNFTGGDCRGRILHRAVDDKSSARFSVCWLR
jgi:hypothetical protein